MQLARPIFAQMPEVAAAERRRLIYLGYIADEQVFFVITRMVAGVITFRLLHQDLERLQRATLTLVQSVVQATIAQQQLEISSPVVQIYKRKYDHIIINGRIITHPLREVIREHWRDFLVFPVALSLAIVTFAPLVGGFVDKETVWFGMIERFNTVMDTTSLILFLQFLATYFQIRRRRLINWIVGSGQIETRKSLLRRVSRQPA